jgi:hypothetical protein
MLAGARAIHKPQLWLLPEELYRRADLLVQCDDHPSDLGTYHYRVKEIKRSPILQSYHECQAALYNRILGHI